MMSPWPNLWAMMLSADEKNLLRLIAQAGKPVAASAFFRDLYPPPAGMGDEGPERDAWTEQQLGMYRAYTDLYKKGLIEVVLPADGLNPDLVVPTTAGIEALA